MTSELDKGTEFTVTIPLDMHKLIMEISAKNTSFSLYYFKIYRNFKVIKIERSQIFFVV